MLKNKFIVKERFSMNGRIKMTPQELNDGANYLRDRLSNISEEVNSLNSKVQEVTGCWEGASQEAFSGRFNEDLYPILRDTVPQVIEAMATKLDAAANTIRDTDSELASAFRG
jgi:WXG100 family type VII secretion target